MKKNIYNIALTVLAAITLAGCGKFLAEESQSEIIPRSAEDFSELLVGSGYPDPNGPDMSTLYYLDDDCAQCLNYSYSAMNWSTSEMETLPADYFAGKTASVSPSPYYQWQPTMCDFNGYNERINTESSGTMYYQFYQKIKGCNAVLDLIDDSVGPQALKDRVKAEALAIRAMLYLQLVNIYGEPYNYNKQAPGVPLKLDSNLSSEPLARATVGEVYEKVIIPDLTMAAELMDPLDYIKKNYRINQPCIHILLSRAYLYMGEGYYDKVISEVDKAMSFGIRVMDLTTEFDPGTVSAYSNTPCFTYDNPEVLWLFGSYTRVDGTAYAPAMSDEFQALWDKANDRRYSMFHLSQTNTYSNDNAFIIYKPTTGLRQVIRTSEAALNKMEAEALSGKGSPMDELNAFRATRIAGYSPETLAGDELLKAIRLERRKELCYEGHRWFDLRRQGMPEIKHVYKTDTDEKGGEVYTFTLKEKDPLYTIPLPSCLLEQNKSLTQNNSRNSAERTGVKQ